jgi:hypothetical protein
MAQRSQAAPEAPSNSARQDEQNGDSSALAPQTVHSQGKTSVSIAQRHAPNQRRNHR